MNIEGRYIKSNFEANKRFSSVDGFKAELQLGIQLWDIACIRDKLEEDNDTDEEESDEEPDTEEQAKLLKAMSSLLHSRKANVNDLKKGFVFFMDQEKSELRQIRNKMRQKKTVVKEVEGGKEEAKEWWDDSPDFHPISEWTLQVNEYYDVSREVQQGPYSQTYITSEHQENRLQVEEEESDEEFEWCKNQEISEESYFVYVNKNRTTVRPGDQIYYCYGNRNNKFLLQNYGFCFEDNKRDSFSISIRMAVNTKNI